MQATTHTLLISRTREYDSGPTVPLLSYTMLTLQQSVVKLLFGRVWLPDAVAL